jgi:alpha-mannosidase
VAALKPSDDGKAWIVRLFGASGKAEKATLLWADPQPRAVHASDTSEQRGASVTGPIDVPPYGIVTLRAERAE